MANGCLTTFPSALTSKTSYPHHSSPSKPIKLQLSFSCSYSSPFSLKKKSHFPSIVASVATQSEEQTEEAIGQEGDFSDPPEDAKVFVGNLPFDVDSEKLAQLFEQAGVVEIAEVIYNRETDQSRGFGFVSMSSVEEADKAVDMFSRYDLNGRFLTVNKAAPRGSQPERTPRTFEPASRIYVGNLPWDVDDSRLEQVFSEHGKVVSARVVYDRDSGRSRGFGFVTMSTEAELNDAIANLDGQSLSGRSIRVNVAEERRRRDSF